MPYDFVERNRRLRSRSDLSGGLTHLTRCASVEGQSQSAIQVLVRILRERRLRGSTTDSGFIIGSTPAVCFFDSPLYAICEHLDYEYESERKPPKYEAAGILLPKEYVYARGGRPVIYEKRDVGKLFLPKKEWWRLVHLELSDARLVDWTHEREWRVPGDLELDLAEATIVLGNSKLYRQFLAECANGGENVAAILRSFVDLSALYV